MEIEDLLHTIAMYASLHGVSGKQHHYDKVKETIAEVMNLANQPTINEIKITKYKNGRPTVVDWNGERWVLDSQTTFRGGVQRGKKQAHKT